jgi:hypothetical protein
MHVRNRGVESFEKMSREGKIIEKERKYKYMCMRERKIREREKRNGKKDMRGLNQVKKK